MNTEELIAAAEGLVKELQERINGGVRPRIVAQSRSDEQFGRLGRVG